jgi:hypothetical protein
MPCVNSDQHDDKHLDLTGNTWLSAESKRCDVFINGERCMKIAGHPPDDDGWHLTHIQEEIKAVRNDAGKPAYDLVPAAALHELVMVYTMGAKKYAPRNWEKGLLYSRMFASMMRHAWAFWRGEDIDAESGLHHMAHVAWGALGLVEYAKRNLGEDDRVK